MIPEWIDRIGEAYATGAYAEEAARARREWVERTGRVPEGPGEAEHDLDEALREFLEWYVLDRPLPGGPDGETPARRYLRERGAGLPGDDLALLRALCASQRSVFEIEGMRPGVLDLFDLVLGGRWRVRERRAIVGAEPGDAIEARLVWRPDGPILGPTVLLHPSDAVEALHARIARLAAAGRPRLYIVEDLGRCRTRCDYFRNVPPSRIYGEE